MYLYILFAYICGLAYSIDRYRRIVAWRFIIDWGHEIYTSSVSGKCFSHFVTSETQKPKMPPSLPPIKMCPVHWTAKRKSFAAGFKMPFYAQRIINGMAFYWHTFLGLSDCQQQTNQLHYLINFPLLTGLCKQI